jgi:Metallo-beta-lactamase superfamily
VTSVDEVLPRLFHWRTRHPSIGVLVDSYWLDESGVLIDPLVPAEHGIEWFSKDDAEPRAVLLTNRHHYRDAGRFAQRFGCSVHCCQAAMHEFTAKQRVQPFEFGDQLAGGVLACEVDAICPDESALYIPSHHALAIADGVVLGGPRGAEGLLGFVPDSLMEEPAQTKRGLLCAYARLLEELDFEHLLLAHGGPIIGTGRDRLQELIDVGGRTAFEAFD